MFSGLSRTYSFLRQKKIHGPTLMHLLKLAESFLKKFSSRNIKIEEQLLLLAYFDDFDF